MKGKRSKMSIGLGKVWSNANYKALFHLPWKPYVIFVVCFLSRF